MSLNNFTLYRGFLADAGWEDWDELGTYENMETAMIAMAHYRNQHPSDVFIIDEGEVVEGREMRAVKHIRSHYFRPEDCCG